MDPHWIVGKWVLLFAHQLRRWRIGLVLARLDAGYIGTELNILISTVCVILCECYTVCVTLFALYCVCYTVCVILCVLHCMCYTICVTLCVYVLHCMLHCVCYTVCVILCMVSLVR
jgi:hypothetical protein